MDFANERYVRVYTRDTADLLAIGWEGRLVLYELLRKVDRAGVIELDGDVLPEMLRVPRNIFEVGWPRLLERGVIEAVTNRDGKSHAVVPNFIEAQEATQSDKHRQRESRARRRELARLGELGVTNRHATVTPRDERSQTVTDGHSVPSRAVPSRAVPCTSTRAPDAPKIRTVEDLASDDARSRLLAQALLTEWSQSRPPGCRAWGQRREQETCAELLASYGRETLEHVVQFVRAGIERKKLEVSDWSKLWARKGEIFGIRLSELEQERAGIRSRASPRGPVDPATQNHDAEVPF
jgi:hypothetical protein